MDSVQNSTRLPKRINANIPQTILQNQKGRNIGKFPNPIHEVCTTQMPKLDKEPIKI